MGGAHRCFAGQGDPGRCLTFSTDDYAPRHRLDAWREVYGRTMLKLEIEPLATGEIHADVLMRKLPDLGIIVGARSPSVYRRERIDNDDVVLSIGLTEAFEASQFGRTATMGRGAAVAVTGAAPGHILLPAGGEFITWCLPRRTISHAVAGLDEALCRPIAADNAALKLLVRYMSILDEADTLATPDLQRHAATHVHDLIALTIGATREAGDIAKLRGARAARLHAIKQDIDDNLGGDLSIGAVAARHRLQPRYVQRLFESEGMTFTEFVLAQRLARAYRMLTDPRLADRPVGTIAFSVGFADPSYFHRAFRRRFGETPAGIRVGARRLDA
jgi:AraC-like DNA-binding protein